MKLNLLSLFAFGGLLASSIANPIGAAHDVVKRDDGDDYTTQGVLLTDLFSNVQVQTAQINKTLDAVPDQPTDAQTDAAAAAVAPQLQTITTLLNTAADSVSKRDLEARNFGKADIFVLVSKLLWELLFVVKNLIFKLGLGKVLIYLSPLVLALVKLVKALDLVVGGLLIAVKDIVNELLKAVGLGLLGLL